MIPTRLRAIPINYPFHPETEWVFGAEKIMVPDGYDGYAFDGYSAVVITNGLASSPVLVSLPALLRLQRTLAQATQMRTLVQDGYGAMKLDAKIRYFAGFCAALKGVDNG